MASRVEVRRSARRSRTVSAYREDDRTVVLIPARFSAAQERHWVRDMLGKLEAKDRRSEQRRRSGARGGDAGLSGRARELSIRYLDGRALPASVRWVSNMSTRWASCTPTEGTIRVSDRLREMPDWVLDYVVVHELSHLLVAAHDHRFWALVGRFERTERARGYLEGVSAAGRLGIAGDGLVEDFRGDNEVTGPARLGVIWPTPSAARQGRGGRVDAGGQAGAAGSR